jgi:hypothetical protein
LPAAKNAPVNSIGVWITSVKCFVEEGPSLTGKMRYLIRKIKAGKNFKTFKDKKLLSFHQMFLYSGCQCY